MVASINSSDLYSPFQHPSMLEEGPQSSEDGSGLHSPVFGQSHDFRYQDQADIEDAAGILRFDYTSSIIQQQQPPLIDTTLVTPSPNAHHSNFSTDYSIAARNQPDIQYLPQTSVNTRASHFSPGPGGEALDFRYNSSERRSSGRQSHDPMVRRVMDGDQPLTPVSPVELSESSTAFAGNRSRERRETSTVVIACRQCRSRKIRCDSARPVCTNCHRRKNVCEYDAAPKRRGPDKRPGTRRRSCKKRPADGSTPPPSKRKKIETDEVTSTNQISPSTKSKTAMTEKKRSLSTDKHGQVPIESTYEDTPPGLRISTDNTVIKNHLGRRYSSSMDYDDIHYKSPYPGPLDINVLRPTEKMVHEKFPSPSSPTVESAQHDWWARFLTTHSIGDIAADAEYLFSDTGHWLSFLNLDYFLQTLYHPEDRLAIRPPLILSILAMATLMKSSQAEFGVKGRERALMYRESARAALESSWNSGWLDPMLAEAALILTLFETSVHPQYNPDRISESLLLLDDIIRHLGLTGIDASDPDMPHIHLIPSHHGRILHPGTPPGHLFRYVTKNVGECAGLFQLTTKVESSTGVKLKTGSTIRISCLMIFHHDRSLITALDLAKSIVIPIDVMNVLWPCPLQQRHCAILREQLTEACNSAGVDPPSAPEFSIPPALQTM
ncbi:hypothetical protein HHX47_DHR3000283 [Lentinula edodes]|nr:hypothetical protein HHX47_DHR3000283 [Lentinula edodes]